MKLRYYAEADVGVDHRRTLELLESIYEEHTIPVEVVQVNPQRAPPEFVGEAETRSLEDAWSDFTYNQTLQEGLGGAPSKRYRDQEDIAGNVGIVVDNELVWATEFWGTHHGWGNVDPTKTAIGFLEEVEARGTPAVAERVPLEDWSWSPDSSGSSSGSRSESRDGTNADVSVAEIHEPTRNAIRDLCTAQSFQRGVSYFEDGRIRELTVEGSEVTAKVRGSRDYRTTVDLSAENFDGWCSCPYDYAGDCKHIVAVLLAVRDRYDEMVEQVQGKTTSDDPSSASDSVSLETSIAGDDLETALETADIETLRDFLRAVLADNESLRERFLATVGQPAEKSVADYKRDIDRRFENATGRRGIIEYDTHLEFADYDDLAAAYRETGESERALEIYRALSEAIRENLERIDDSSGYYGRQLESAIDAYAACLCEAEFDPETRREHLESLYEQYRIAEFRFVRDYYDGALREACTTADDLEYLLSLVQADLSALDGIASDEPGAVAAAESGSESDTPQTEADIDDAVEIDEWLPDPTQWRLEVELFTGGELDVEHLAVGPLEVTDFVGETLTTILDEMEPRPGKYVVSAESRGGDGRPEQQPTLSVDEQQLLSTYLWTLSELEEREQLAAVLEEVYTERSEFYRHYVDVLRADGQDERAQEVVEDGLEEFPHSVDVHQLAAEFYQGLDDERYREVLRTLFIRFEDWDAYDDLRSASSAEEWESISHGLRTQLGRIDPDRLIELYVREGDLENALETVLESGDLETLRRYRASVAEVDPEAYFEAYRDLLDPYLAADTGRDHYRTVIEHLRDMEELGFDAELAAFVEHLRENHSNRPAFLDELETAGY